MRFVRAAAIAAILLGAVGTDWSAFAGITSSKAPQTAIFLANRNDVLAYPVGSKGDVPPIALTTDMEAPSGIARDSSDRLYVTNSATNTVTVYAAGASGNVPPIAVIGGSNTRLSIPRSIALDASGKIYVLNNSYNSLGGVNVYPPLNNSTGVLNETPIATIVGPATQMVTPVAIAADGPGDVYVANQQGGPTGPGGVYAPGVVTVYPAGSNGNVSPSAVIAGAATGLVDPLGIALDSKGNIYVSNSQVTVYGKVNLSFDASVVVYPSGSSGNVSPTTSIVGNNTGLEFPFGIALDLLGNLYATGLVEGVGNDISNYAVGSNGNVPPLATIIGAQTGLDGPDGMVLDSTRDLYVSNVFGGAGGGSVTVYSSGSTGNASPITTITSDFTGISGSASHVAIDFKGKIYVANDDSITVYPAGSYATSPPLDTISGDNTGLFVPIGIGVDGDGNVSVLNDDGMVTTYQADSSGNATPIATLNIYSGKNNSPSGIAVARGGKIYVTNTGDVICNSVAVCRQPSSGNLVIYGPGSDANAKPSAVISGSETKLASPAAVAVDRSGYIYVANQGRYKNCFRRRATMQGRVTIYPPDSDGDASPIAAISGARTRLDNPYGIAVGEDGSIYVLNGGFGICPGVFIHTATRKLDGPILVFAAGSNGDVEPTAAIGGPLTGLGFPEGIAVGPTGP